MNHEDKRLTAPTLLELLSESWKGVALPIRLAPGHKRMQTLKRMREQYEHECRQPKIICVHPTIWADLRLDSYTRKPNK